MLKHTLAKRVGITIIILRVLTIAIVISFFVTGKFLLNELTSLLVIITPVLGIYSTLIVRYIINSESKKHTQVVSQTYSLLSFLLPIVYMISMVLLVFWYVSSGRMDFDRFKVLIGLVEVIFGPLVSIMLGNLFALSTIGQI